MSDDLLQLAVNLLLKRGNDLFSCPISIEVKEGAEKTEKMENEKMENTQNVEKMENVVKIEPDEEQFELL